MRKRKIRLIILISTLVLIIAAITSLLIIIFSVTKDEISTYKVKEEEIDILDSKQGYLIFDDKKIEVPSKEKFVYSVFNFDHLMAGDTLGYVYFNATNEQIEKLNTLNEQIYKYEKSLNYLELSQLETEEKISSLLSKISYYKSIGNIDYANNLSFELDIYNLRNELFYSQNNNYEYELIALKDTKDACIANMGKGLEIKSSYEGTFIKETDGYEGQLSYDDITSIINKNQEYLSSINKNDESNIVGRIIKSNNAFFLTKLSSLDTSKYYKEKPIFISFDYLNTPMSNCIVESIKKSTLYDDVYMLTSFNFNYDMAYMPRLTNVSISYEKKSSFPIPKECVYNVKGKTCVYVLEDNKAKLKQIDIISEYGSSYFVEGAFAATYPALNDGDNIIITKNKIYDGKKVI